MSFLKDFVIIKRLIVYGCREIWGFFEIIKIIEYLKIFIGGLVWRIVYRLFFIFVKAILVKGLGINVY